MADIDGTGFAELDELLALVRRTRELLDAAIAEGELPDDGVEFLADATLPHVEGIQAGFRGWLRSEGVARAELQYLIGLTAGVRSADPASPADASAAAVERRLDERVRELWPVQHPLLRNARAVDLVRLAHARVVLAFLPRLPGNEVRYPSPLRTYADISVPRGPAELLERLIELERLLWQVATRRRLPTHDPAVRRTYGFFDAADRLGWRAFMAA
ncbi:MAG TPA: hypothetical protein VFS32_09255 [Candidatus Limnocylindrales bacterium]|nr:hypothetical protein [Candidatus Limnocylindrales bacterium]